MEDTWQPPASTPPSVAQLPFVNSDLDQFFQGGTLAFMMRFMKSHGYWKWLWIVIGVDAVATIAYYFSPYLATGGVFVPIGLFAFTLLPFFLGILPKIEGAFMQRFATIMGYTFSPLTPIGDTKSRFTSIGRAVELHNVLTGTFENRPIRLFEYIYGQGRSEGTLAIFEITFSGKLPTMQLSSVFMQPLLMTSLHAYVGGEEKLKLEGDFDNHFNLSAPQGTQIEDLQIFTPDFMQQLLESYKPMSFECAGDKLLICLPGNLPVTRKGLFNYYLYADLLNRKLSQFEGKIDTAAASIPVPTPTG